MSENANAHHPSTAALGMAITVFIRARRGLDVRDALSHALIAAYAIDFPLSNRPATSFIGCSDEAERQLDVYADVKVIDDPMPPAWKRRKETEGVEMSNYDEHAEKFVRQCEKEAERQLSSDLVEKLSGLLNAAHLAGRIEQAREDAEIADDIYSWVGAYKAGILCTTTLKTVAAALAASPQPPESKQESK